MVFLYIISYSDGVCSTTMFGNIALHLCANQVASSTFHIIYIFSLPRSHTPPRHTPILTPIQIHSMHRNKQQMALVSWTRGMLVPQGGRR